jgi:vancomycin resistance protein VanW
MAPSLTDPESLLSKSRAALALRRARVGWLQGRRLLAWARSPARWPRPPVAPAADAFPFCVYRRELPIGRSDPGADPDLERGKLVNLRIAAPHFDGLELSPSTPLSFWRVLGPCTRARGFRYGAELRGGCIRPTLGGGLCLLSNALFRAACELGWTILERHGHTMEAAPPDSDAVWGLDATVFWPHVDLRLAPRTGRVRLDVRVAGERLHLHIDATEPIAAQIELVATGDVTYDRGGERVRANQVIRRGYDATGGVPIVTDVVAHNRKRLLHSDGQRRNCFTCGEADCRARPPDLPGDLLGAASVARTGGR